MLIDNGSFIGVKWARLNSHFYIIFLSFLGVVPDTELCRLRVKHHRNTWIFTCSLCSLLCQVINQVMIII